MQEIHAGLSVFKQEIQEGLLALGFNREAIQGSQYLQTNKNRVAENS